MAAMVARGLRTSHFAPPPAHGLGQFVAELGPVAFELGFVNGRGPGVVVAGGEVQEVGQVHLGGFFGAGFAAEDDGEVEVLELAGAGRPAGGGDAAVHLAEAHAGFAEAAAQGVERVVEGGEDGDLFVAVEDLGDDVEGSRLSRIHADE